MKPPQTLQAEWWRVCDSEDSSVVPSDGLCLPIEESNLSPIDSYYKFVAHVITLGTPESLSASPTLGRLLLLGLVGGVEGFFRELLAGVLRVCPIARLSAAEQVIPYGAVDYYGPSEIELGLFDAVSLAGGKEIRNKTNKLLGLDMTDKSHSSLRAAIDEFDKLCHMRHASVHALGRLGAGNAAALNYSSTARQLELRLDFASLQAAAAVCHSVVRAYNKFVFRSIVDRWASSGRLRADRDQVTKQLHALYTLCASRSDDGVLSFDECCELLQVPDDSFVNSSG